jgi:hypothetical protein
MSIKKERDIPSLSVYSDSLAKTCAQAIQKVQVLQCLIFSIAFFSSFRAHFMPVTFHKSKHMTG